MNLPSKQVNDILKSFIELQKEQLKVEKAKAEADKAKLELVSRFNESIHKLVKVHLQSRFYNSAALLQLLTDLFVLLNPNQLYGPLQIMRVFS